MTTYGIPKRVFEKVLEVFMKIYEKIEKASAILNLPAMEKRMYLKKISYSNNIHDHEDVCQELASMLIYHMDKNNLEDDLSMWQLVDDLHTARAFYCAVNYSPTRRYRGDKMAAFYRLSEAAGVCEIWLSDYPKSQSLIYTGIATPKELEGLYLKKFGKKVEFDPEDRVDENILSELVNYDLLCRQIFVMSTLF